VARAEGYIADADFRAFPEHEDLRHNLPPTFSYVSIDTPLVTVYFRAASK
jgi:hypothetical protein